MDVSRVRQGYLPGDDESSYPVRLSPRPVPTLGLWMCWPMPWFQHDLSRSTCVLRILGSPMNVLDARLARGLPVVFGCLTSGYSVPSLDDYDSLAPLQAFPGCTYLLWRGVTVGAVA